MRIELNITSKIENKRMIDLMKKFFLLICLLSFLFIPFLCQAQTEIFSVEKWGNVFGGKNVIFNFGVKGEASFHGEIGWRFESGGHTIARGEQFVTLSLHGYSTIEVRLQIPDVKEGVIMKSTLSLFVKGEKADAVMQETEKIIWIFPEDPFSNQKQWLKDLNIHVFDIRSRDTAQVLSEADIPFKEVKNIDAISEIKEGILIIGENVPFKAYPALADSLITAAAKGLKVIGLSPGYGWIPVPVDGRIDVRGPERLLFEGEKVIKKLDNRLDSLAWPKDGNLLTGGVKLATIKNEAVLEIVKGDAGGWPWMEMDFAQYDGKVIICGFGIISHWNDGPAPRFLFAKLLAYVTQPKSEKGEK